MEKIKQFILEKKYYIISVLILLLIGISVFLIFNRKSVVKANELIENVKLEIEEEKEEKIVENCLVKVDIKGEVNNPGLYEMECSERVNDVIIKAGGLKKNADTTTINLSKKVFDQMVIIVYSKEKESVKEKIVEKVIIKNDACVCDQEKTLPKEESESILDQCQNSCVDNITITDDNKTVDDNKISLNSASKEELMMLTGIGESKALNIIKYREENNGFKSLDELMNISGIGEKAFEKIKDNIKL